MKTIQIPLRLPSDKPELTCNDGEVERFANVDWLQALADADNNSSSSSSGGNNSGNNPSDEDDPDLPVFSLHLSDLPVSLPFEGTLLAIHAPEALGGRHRYLVHTANYALIIADPDGNTQTLIHDTYNNPGEIRSVATHGDFILVATEKALLRIVFDPSTLSYTLTGEAPAPPDVLFSLSPTVMPDYVNSIGEWPALTVAVDLPSAEEVSLPMLTNWLDLGSGTAVNTVVRQAVFRAVGEAVENFVAEARRRNLFLTSLRCMASFGGVLPTSRITVNAPDSSSSPCAILDSWTYHAGTLRLQLSLTLSPLSLSADFDIPQEQAIWVSRFDSLDLYVTSQTPVFPAASGNLEATNLTSYTDPVSGTRRGYAFRFPTFTEAERKSAINSLSDFRRVDSRHPSIAAASSIHLRPSTSSDPLFTPDYADLSTAVPETVVATDQGFVLYGGYANIGLDREHWPVKSRRLPLCGSLLSSIPDHPFIFRHFTHVSDGEIRIVAATSSSRTASASGRHPLHVLSSDGIRRLEADGHGGYLNGRMVSRLAAIAPLSACYADLLYFFAADGLHSLSLSSTVKSLGMPMPDSSGAAAAEGVIEWDCMEMMTDGSTLLLRGPGRTALLDLAAERCVPLPDVSLRPLVSHEDTLYTLSSFRRLQKITLSKSPAPPAAAAIPAALALPAKAIPKEAIFNEANCAEAVKAEERVEERAEEGPAPLALPQYADILTRPMKFSAGMKGARLRGVSAVSPDIFMILEGSQNLTDWFEIARGHGRIFPLHIPAIRFYRLRARTTVDLSPLLASFDFHF